MGGYGPVEKRYHMCRRRRWVRLRLKVKDMQVIAAEVSRRDLAGSRPPLSTSSLGGQLIILQS